MCLLIFEILLFVMGIYAVISAKLPSWFVGKGYIAEGSPVRILGLVMAAPLPIAFCAGAAIGLIDPDQIWIGSAIEIVGVLAAAIITVVTLRNIRKPEQPPQVIEMKQE
ncbi:MAG: hypothetical protein HND47_15940 [Chloroflexi bacterium]|nr:hypothetical protein [Chloroflexota bacterium]